MLPYMAQITNELEIEKEEKEKTINKNSKNNVN